jgi:8-oxo-dGTP pyrophosphatase MutT (NUDIX family)
MHRRSSTKPRFPGYLIGPGGRIDEGEDVITAIIREVTEETGITVKPPQISLKVIAIHYHLDREEVWMNFISYAKLTEPPGKISDSVEGTSEWLTVSELMSQDKVFEPSSIYFDHVLNNRPGIMYTNSEWRNSRLVRELSRTVV